MPAPARVFYEAEVRFADRSVARRSPRSIVLSRSYRGEWPELQRQSIGPDLMFFRTDLVPRGSDWRSRLQLRCVEIILRQIALTGRISSSTDPSTLPIVDHCAIG